MSSAVMFTPVSSTTCFVPSARTSVFRTVALLSANFFKFNCGTSPDFFSSGFVSFVGFCSDPLVMGSKLLFPSAVVTRFTTGDSSVTSLTLMFPLMMSMRL